MGSQCTFSGLVLVFLVSWGYFLEVLPDSLRPQGQHRLYAHPHRLGWVISKEMVRTLCWGSPKRVGFFSELGGLDYHPRVQGHGPWLADETQALGPFYPCSLYLWSGGIQWSPLGWSQPPWALIPTCTKALHSHGCQSFICIPCCFLPWSPKCLERSPYIQHGTQCDLPYFSILGTASEVRQLPLLAMWPGTSD